MGVGVNLWNTLDAVGDWFDPDDIEAWDHRTVGHKFVIVVGARYESDRGE